MPPRHKVAIVADDLTGAMDTAAPFAARGVATRVFLSLPRDGIAGVPAVVSITTDSRHLHAREAMARVAAAIKAIGDESRLLLKKVDSTMRGNVAQETLAALEASGRRHALVCPAFPAQGRTLEDGEVRVHGVALRDTTIGRDALSPPPCGALAQVFAQAASVWSIHSVPRGTAVALAESAGTHVYIVDAVEQGDLARIAQCAVSHLEETILVGSAGLGHALAEADFERQPAARRDCQPGPVLCVVGSRTPQSERQTQRLCQAGATCLSVRAQGGRLHTPPLPDTDAASLVLRVEQVDAEPVNAVEVAAALASFSSSLLRTRPFAGLIVTGGDTARALLAALGVDGVDLLGEVMPGVALGAIPLGGRNLPIVTKAGGFGGEDLFVDIVKKLTAT